jgi:hypothetical protein
MLDLWDLAFEAEMLAQKLRAARCCDALAPCYRCSLLKYNVLARRRVVEIPGPTTRMRSSHAKGALAPAARNRDLELHAS